MEKASNDRWGVPFVMHLDRVARLMEMGTRFDIEINPNCDLAERFERRPCMMLDMQLRVLAGGGVEIMVNSRTGYEMGLTLANYKRIWRCWQNGAPTAAQSAACKWA